MPEGTTIRYFMLLMYIEETFRPIKRWREIKKVASQRQMLDSIQKWLAVFLGRFYSDYIGVITEKDTKALFTHQICRLDATISCFIKI